MIRLVRILATALLFLSVQALAGNACRFRLNNCTFSCVDDLACWNNCTAEYEACTGSVVAPEFALSATGPTPDEFDENGVWPNCPVFERRLRDDEARVRRLQDALQRAAPSEKPELVEQIKRAHKTKERNQSIVSSYCS